MRKVLIVSPRFPPASAPDQHRVRTSLPYFAQYGWEPTVLCATSETTDGVPDPLLASTIPGDIHVERVAAWPESACRRLGFGHFNFRCVVPLYRGGTALLAQERYDLVYFSTTAFPTFVLGRLWKRRFGCSIAFDYQDPWFAGVRRTYDRRTAPGGIAKYAVSQVIGRVLEPIALRAADGLVSVSSGYLEALRRSYPWLRRVDSAVIPFGAPFLDFDCLARAAVGQSAFDPRDGLVHWVYAGVVVPHMWPVLRELFRTIATLRGADPARWRAVRLNFIGTSYAPAAAQPNIARMASEFGLADMVVERTARIPYMEALRTLQDSQGVLVIGSVFGEYTPSKTFVCALSGRPVLALLQSGSVAARVASECPNVRSAAFEASPREGAFGRQLADGLGWLLSAPEAPVPDPRPALRRYSAEAQTRAQCELFERVLCATPARP